MGANHIQSAVGLGGLFFVLSHVAQQIHMSLHDFLVDIAVIQRLLDHICIDVIIP